MNLVEETERNIAGMTPVEFEEFLVWLRDRVSVHLGGALPVARPSARERAELQEKVREGTAEPFRHVDVEALPEAARRKARKIIGEWRARNGS